MDLTPIDFSLPVPTAASHTGAPTPSRKADSGTLAARWTAIHEAAEGITFLAGIPPETENPKVRDFPETVHLHGDWRRELAEQGVEDLIAMLEPGVTALLAVHDSGGDAKAAAVALWQEFLNARNALIRLVP